MTRVLLSRSFWLFICAAAVIGLIASGWLIQGRTPPDLPVSAPARADYYLRDAEVSVTNDGGELSYRLQATELLRFSDHSSRMTEVRIDSLGGSKGVWQVEAGQAVMSEGQEHLQLSGGIRLRTQSPRGQTLLTTQSLKVNLKDKRLMTADPVRINGPEFEAQADGMQAGFDNRNFTLMNNVHTRYAP